MNQFCGEIAYDGEYFDQWSKKMEVGGIHSDICWHSNEPMTGEYKQFLHDCLDEWLEKSNGTGAFWVGDHDYFLQNFKYSL